MDYKLLLRPLGTLLHGGDTNKQFAGPVMRQFLSPSLKQDSLTEKMRLVLVSVLRLGTETSRTAQRISD